MQRSLPAFLALLATAELSLSPSPAHAQGSGAPMVNGSDRTSAPHLRRNLAPRLGGGAAAQYVFRGVGSGTIGGQAFDSAAFTVLVIADTADVCECHHIGVFEVVGTSAIEIQGIGSAEFEVATRVFSNVSVPAVGFSLGVELGGYDLLDLWEHDFAGYHLDTSIGPVLEQDPLAIDQFRDVPTSLGALTFDSVDQATFEAIVGGGAGCLRLDFQTEDDLVTPLVNGQHVDTEFGDLVTITSSGPNAGLAIFDSSLFGPNDPSQDRDLLVHTGNVLVLQTENFPPDVDDLFPRPNDDSDGGTITFAFATPVAATGVRLIDLDGSDGTSRVVLTDSSARRRTFTIPGNWTGDRLVAGPGHRLLDFATLEPQLGFASVATASEEPGFDPFAIARIDVELAGSGGVDDLVLCGVQRAAVAVRRGSGVNRATLTSLSRPVVGGTFVASLDCGSLGSGLATLRICDRATAGRLTPFGELLVEGALLHRASALFAGSASRLSWTIPHDPALIGLEVHAQGSCLSSSAGLASKTLQLRGGLSNALDLVIGF